VHRRAEEINETTKQWIRQRGLKLVPARHPFAHAISPTREWRRPQGDDRNWGMAPMEAMLSQMVLLLM
jgi:hypothetical protein